MINFLGSVLSPIFAPMGVSEADLLSYLNMLQGYVWGILAIIAAVIVKWLIRLNDGFMS